ncbi:MAG TPA: diguanylate cyclase [Anaerolineaceae bacterium]|nr:diguanylate cyclase [Anaerolineaceae bacterium]HPN52883.1 diguanylate cyclase [Anaerolineaceae bacterium]
MTVQDRPSYQSSASFSAHFASFRNDLAECISRLKENYNLNNMQRLIILIQNIEGVSVAQGYTSLGQSAREIKTLASAFLQPLLPPPPPSPEQISSLMNKLTGLLDLLSNETLAAAPPVAHSLAVSISATNSLQDSRAARRIFLLESDLAECMQLALQIGYFGYSVQSYSNFDDLLGAIQQNPPSALLMDLTFMENSENETDFIQRLRRHLPDETPVISISDHDDISSRLKAARAGSKIYFLKPVNAGSLVDALDRLVAAEDPIPYRILIIDDDNMQASINAINLRKAGMETEVLTEPLKVFQSLQEFNPDLILLDIYMPECTGKDLANIIRQVEAYVSIPIVYLSTETDRDIQLDAVRLGGDDFLTKPIKPSHLISSISARVERYRQLRHLMLRDSLTGLLNHTTLKERFAQEANRAIRQNRSMAYAMIDLDSFKSVNDTYGHATGDRVLKTLAQMLTRRLRSTDIIGRYGGEEFAVVLPNTNGSEAALIIDQLRIGFGRVLHRASDKEFTVTFSAGIASYPECSTPSLLAEAADRALYDAKNQGRNQVVIAPPS